MNLSLNYENRKPERPWGIELPDGERRYFREVRLFVPAWTVLEDAQPRRHGYLQFEGELHENGDVAEVRSG